MLRRYCCQVLLYSSTVQHVVCICCQGGAGNSHLAAVSLPEHGLLSMQLCWSSGASTSCLSHPDPPHLCFPVHLVHKLLPSADEPCKLHEGLFVVSYGVCCRAPMAFFHTTPMGRIINRMTKDTADVDKFLVSWATHPTVLSVLSWGHRLCV